MHHNQEQTVINSILEEISDYSVEIFAGLLNFLLGTVTDRVLASNDLTSRILTSVEIVVSFKSNRYNFCDSFSNGNPYIGYCWKYFLFAYCYITFMQTSSRSFDQDVLIVSPIATIARYQSHH